MERKSMSVRCELRTTLNPLLARVPPIVKNSIDTCIFKHLYMHESCVTDTLCMTAIVTQTFVAIRSDTSEVRENIWYGTLFGCYIC